MSGETADAQSGWTTDTLHSHLTELLEAQRVHLQAVIDERDKRYDQRMTDAEKAVQAALKTAEKATDKADQATEKRFDNTNEFRQQLNDQAGTLYPRSEAETRFRALSDRLDTMAKANDEKLNALAGRLDRGEGKGAGLQAGWGYLLGAVGLSGGIVAIAVAIAH
jgi:small-conductance mechanosensitive channel